MLKLSSILQLLSIIVMGKVFLLIVFNNLPFPFSSYYFIALCWFAALAFFDAKILLSRPLLYVYFFGVSFFFLMYIGIYEPDYHRVFHQIILPLLLAFSIYSFYIMNQDYKGFKLLVGITLFFIVITSITSIVGMSTYPYAARELGGALARDGETQTIEKYASLGIASFGFFSGLAFSFPALIALVKSKWHRHIEIKMFFAIGFIIIVYSFIKAQYTMAFLFVLFGSILAVVSSKHRVKTAYILSFIIIIVLIISPPVNFFLDPLYDLAGYFGSDRLQARIYDFGIFLTEGQIDRADKTHVGSKMGRIPILIDSIIESPVFGSGFSSGHNFWLDWISKYGFAGLIPWILIIRQQIMYHIKVLNKESLYYYLLSMLMFVAFGFINNMGGQQMYIIVFLLIPGLFYLKGSLEGSQDPELNKGVVQI